MLTEQMLKEMPAGTIFAEGDVPNGPDGVFMVDIRIDDLLHWIAKRGDGYWDWAIYCYWKGKDNDWIKKYGDKIVRDAYIKKLVPCDEDAFKLYRK